jgi:hypothetical protein
MVRLALAGTDSLYTGDDTDLGSCPGNKAAESYCTAY